MEVVGGSTCCKGCFKLFAHPCAPALRGGSIVSVALCRVYSNTDSEIGVKYNTRTIEAKDSLLDRFAGL